MSVTTAPTAEPLGRSRSSAVGVLAGLLTLAVASIFLWQQGTFSRASAVAATEVNAGDCFNLSSSEAMFEVVSCATAHSGEIVSVIEHPDADGPYPGDQVTSVWFEQKCAEAADSYVGDDIRTTTLSAQLVAPDRDAWADGMHAATCYITSSEEAGTLSGSVQGQAAKFSRPGTAKISDLAAGDCFSPPQGRNPFDLRTGDTVNLVDCNGSYHGIFFGRADLPFPDDLDFPDADELSRASTAVCSGEFEDHFGVESSIGYTFRFWRPSRTDWDSGSREVLCAVLSDTRLDAPFVPADYPALANLGTGQCFVLLPEQDAGSLSLDDHVRPVVCSDPHVGQMIGTGQLPVDTGFPGNDEAKLQTERECRDRFETFVGISPSESTYGKFPYWFPDERSWNNGDTRYACAILGDEVLTGSIQNSRD